MRSVALISAVNWYLKSRSTSWFSEGQQKLPRRQREERCIDVGRTYFEKEEFQNGFLKNTSSEKEQKVLIFYRLPLV